VRETVAWIDEVFLGGFGDACSAVRRRRYSLVVPGGLPVAQRVSGDAITVLNTVLTDWPTWRISGYHLGRHQGVRDPEGRDAAGGGCYPSLEQVSRVLRGAGDRVPDQGLGSSGWGGRSGGWGWGELPGSPGGSPPQVPLPLVTVRAHCPGDGRHLVSRPPS
jgi:hypothetical protein